MTPSQEGTALPGTEGKRRPGETWLGQVTKGTAQPVLPPLLPKRLSAPTRNQTAKSLLEMNVLHGKGLAKETDSASFLQPSCSPEAGKIPFERGIWPSQ